MIFQSHLRKAAFMWPRIGRVKVVLGNVFLLGSTQSWYPAQIGTSPEVPRQATKRVKYPCIIDFKWDEELLKTDEVVLRPEKNDRVISIRESEHSSTSSSKGRTKKKGRCLRRQYKRNKTLTTIDPIAQKRHGAISTKGEIGRNRLCFTKMKLI